MNSGTTLTTWQKKQAALLYYFASLSYLKDVKTGVDKLLSFSESTLDLARHEHRDLGLKSTQWGNRDTAENWANSAWPFLADFQLSLAKNIANRAVEVYSITGRNQCARGMSEYSMEWTSIDEQERFDQMFSEISGRALNIDMTMNKTGSASQWDDYCLTLAWMQNLDHFPQMPRLRVREDVFAETGSVPVRTGVYVCFDDPNASLQFAWTGGGGGELLECSTLNGLGQAALTAVGRKNLWVNGAAMLSFVSANKSHPDLQADSFFDDSQTEGLAPSLVARQAFTSRACRWYYVELIHDEFEPINEDEDITVESGAALRFEAGTQCLTSGFYFTPAKAGSRRLFNVGEAFPDEKSAYGATIWQWDDRQG